MPFFVIPTLSFVNCQLEGYKLKGLSAVYDTHPFSTTYLVLHTNHITRAS